VGDDELKAFARRIGLPYLLDNWFWYRGEYREYRDILEEWYVSIRTSTQES
jgi:hypothetical protein